MTRRSQAASFSYTGGQRRSSTRTPTSCGRCWSASRGWTASSAPHVYATGKGAKPTVVNTYGRQLLWAQAIATNEKPTPALITGQAGRLRRHRGRDQAERPGVYPLFQGKQWTRPGWRSRSRRCSPRWSPGVLVLLIAITLIILKLGFLLLLVAGPVLPHRRHPSRLRPGGRAALGRDARRRAAQTGGHRAGAERAAVRLLADHGHQRRRAAVGTEDPDDRAGHGRGVHLPQAVRAPVLGRRLRHGRLAGARRGRPGAGPAAPRGGTHSTPRRWACPASPPTGRRAGRGATRRRRRAWPPRSRWPAGGAAAGAAAGARPPSGAGRAGRCRRGRRPAGRQMPPAAAGPAARRPRTSARAVLPGPPRRRTVRGRVKARARRSSGGPAGPRRPLAPSVAGPAGSRQSPSRPAPAQRR